MKKFTEKDFRTKTLAEIEKEDGITEEVNDDPRDHSHGGFYKLCDDWNGDLEKMRKKYDKIAKKYRGE